MNVPKMNSNFRINKLTGNLKIRKEYGVFCNRYVLYLSNSNPMYLTQEDLDRLGDYVNENKETKL